MSFKKPFRAVPVKLGEYYLARGRREKRFAALKLTSAAIILALLVFAVGMFLTNAF